MYASASALVYLETAHQFNAVTGHVCADA